VKVQSRLFLERLGRPFARLPKSLFLAFERARVGASRPERRAGVAGDLLGRLQLLRQSALFGFECQKPQALAKAVKLGSGKVLGAFETRFEASPLGFTFALGNRRGSSSPLAGRFERLHFASRLAFGFAECSRTRIDFFPPERHERLEGVALLQRSFLSAVTRG
jgi:hypothetical protein